MVGVDQFVMDRRDVGNDAEPAKGIDPLERLQPLAFDRLAGRPVIAVATGDEIAVQNLLAATLAEGDLRPVTVEVANGGDFGAIQRCSTVVRSLCHQIAGDLGLPVNHDGSSRQG